MNLEEIRQKVVEFSGRVDLASSDYLTDAGGDFFINAGSRWLDLNFEVQREDAYEDFPLAVSGYEVDVIGCRVVKLVGFLNSDGEWTPLTYAPHMVLLTDYPSWGSSDSETPEYWTRSVSRKNRKAGSYHDVTTITIMGPTSEAITLRVYGLFHADELKNLGDTNYWSEMYPEALAFAACMILEMHNRNTAGMLDYRNSLKLLLDGVDNDTADAATVEGTEMEG